MVGHAGQGLGGVGLGLLQGFLFVLSLAEEREMEKLEVREKKKKKHIEEEGEDVTVFDRFL